MTMYREGTTSTVSVWPDLGNFNYFGEILNVFGNFEQII